MRAISVRLYPYAAADGPHNMAADEVLLLDALEGKASLRFYSWSAATLSLGYFQRADSRLADARLASLPWVRRPTGGGSLVHHHELTYALAIPSLALRAHRSWMGVMHGIIAHALAALGLRNNIEMASRASGSGDFLCFQQKTVGDLLHGNYKLLGSAQRKHHQCLLQHGALLLAQSPFTPMLPGIKELTDVQLEASSLIPAIVEAFRATTGWQVEASEWTAEQRRRIEQLVSMKYGRAEWNEHR